MCKSKYILCPAGDTSWSFRFYETYKYLLLKNVEEQRKLCDSEYNNLVSENTKIFQKFHMLN